MYSAGHTGDYSEVFTGIGVGGPDAYADLTGIYTGVTCHSVATPTGLLSSQGEMTCSDGRKTIVYNTPYQGLLFWQGTGAFPDGTSIKVYANVDKGPIDAMLAQFKQTHAARTAARQAPARPDATVQQTAPASSPAARSMPSSSTADFSSQLVDANFAASPERPDDVAVIIGNADYGRQGHDIPNVRPAYADSDSMKVYAARALGVREGNIIVLKDATGAQMVRVFGSKDNPHGQLYDWVRPGRSNVFVYYAGHGAPGLDGGSPFLIPADADAARIELNGYPLQQLYDNLAQLPARRVTVVLEACFSGLSQAGTVLGKASPVYVKVKAPKPADTLTVISAGAPSQVASWEENGSHGLFTKYFLKGMAGAADKSPYGNGDGQVGLSELNGYLKDTLTYFARRYYGRDQQAQIFERGQKVD